MKSQPAAHCRDDESAVAIGISSCILGLKVRYDGSDKLNSYVRDTLGHIVNFIPICPEVEMGLGVPRETLRLVKRDKKRVSLIAPQSGLDRTGLMKEFTQNKIEAIRFLKLDGFIFQHGSPSCGIANVNVYSNLTALKAREQGQGLFAKELTLEFPQLPVEDSDRLNDNTYRTHFIVRVFAHHRLRLFFAGNWNIGSLVEFHANEKYLLMAHQDYKPLGRIVAHAKSMNSSDLKTLYMKEFLDVLAKPPSIGKHVNALQHMTGYLKNKLNHSAKLELVKIIDNYSQGLVSLIAPLSLIKHHAQTHRVSYLTNQSYINFHPLQLI